MRYYYTIVKGFKVAWYMGTITRKREPGIDWMSADGKWKLTLNYSFKMIITTSKSILQKHFVVPVNKR